MSRDFEVCERMMPTGFQGSASKLSEEDGILIKAFLLMLLMSSAGAGLTAGAQQEKPYKASVDPCDGSGTVVQIRDCENNRVADADQRLNTLYGQILSRLSHTDEQTLRSLEITWIAYRDGQCKAEGLQYAGGTLQPIVTQACMAKETEFRIKDLHAAYDGP